MSAIDGDVDDLLADLRNAHAARERARERVAEVGEAELQAVAEAHADLLDLFDEYEERATGDGDFKAFIEFQEELAGFVERLPEDLRHREAFEEVDDVLQQRRLTESDFETARDHLAPAREDVGRVEERRATETRYRRVYRRVESHLSDVESRIRDLERLKELGEADLSAPVERIRDPIEAYNDAVDDAFAEFKHDAPARRVFRVVSDAAAFPLVPFREPPADLRAYVENHPPGTEPIPQLLTYADYSTSKLAHYVDDPDRLKHAINSDRTYLRRLDADPLTVDWPPPRAAVLRWRVRELVAVVGRFAPENVVAQARALRDLTDDEREYARLRESATARARLDEAERDRLERGAVDRELAELRAERDRLADALAEHPEV